MHLKASKRPAVVVLYVRPSYPVVSRRGWISFKLNQVGPVVMLVHIGSFSKCKFGSSRALLSSLYLFLVGFGEPSVCTFGCGLPGSWACETSLSVPPASCFMILLRGGGCLFEITSSPLGLW